MKKSLVQILTHKEFTINPITKMKTNKRFLCSLFLGAACTLVCLTSQAQYSIPWYKIAGGGGTSSSGQYALSGTIGQADASPTLTGGNYALTGGFWAFDAVLQTPNAPPLYITHSGSTVTVFWQNVAGWSLVQTPDLTTPNWTPSSGVTLSNGTNYLTFPSTSGRQFFRLKHQ